MLVPVTDSRGLPHSELFVLSRRLAMLDSRLSGFSEILIHVVFNFLESFTKWFVDCSHCNQEGPFPTKKTCLVSMIWSHLQTNSSCRSNVLMVLSIVVSTALDNCQLLLLATAGQSDQYRQVPVSPSQTFVDCNTCSATTFV